MKKIVNIIEKSTHIKNRFVNMIKGNRHNLHENPKHHGHHGHHDHDEEDELDNHNDSSNWTYH